MKTFCALALVAGASAATDAAPAISLQLNGAAVVDECTATGEYRAGCGKYGDHTAATTNTQYSTSHPNSFAAKCLVTSAAGTCEEPVATAYDHHDTNSAVVKSYNYFVVSRAACKSYTTTVAGITTGAEALETGSANTRCAMQQGAANTEVGSASFTQPMRNLRGEFIIKYDATDRAGNQASQLIFAMIMVDDAAPTVTRPAAATLEACDMDRAVQHRVTSLHRNTVSVDEAQVFNTDNYDGVSPTLNLANAAERAHGIMYTITQGASVVSSSTTSSTQALYNTFTESATQAGTTDVTYTATDYANIFGSNYADNTNTYSDAWTIQDSTAPRVVPKFATTTPFNPATGESRTTVSGTCGGAIATTGGQGACQCLNYRRAWGTSTTAAACVGFSTTAVYTSTSGYASCGLVNEVSYHECGNSYAEPGFKCIDMRDSFATTSSPFLAQSYNTGTGATKYHVDTEVNMQSPISYNQGASVATARMGATLSTANVAAGYPLFTGDASLIATYTCTDRVGNTATSTRTTIVRDTVAPTLEITTQGMDTINAVTGAAYALATSNNNAFLDNHADATQHTKGMNSHYHTTALTAAGTAVATQQNRGGKQWKADPGLATIAGKADAYTIQHSSGFDSDEQVITNLVTAHKGYACFDDCDGDLTLEATNGVTLSWHEQTCAGAVLTGGFQTLVPGTYALKYVCQDVQGLTTSKCRTIMNEDHTKPVITVLEADAQTYEATRSDNYVDAGATCSDEVDGNISQDVEVSGDVVNLARVGVYTIKYNCQDSASNVADEATRTVVVQDTSCPSCVISTDTTTAASGSTVSIEASFPYNDVGAVATDSLQGSFGICSVWSNGNLEASYKNIVNVEQTGTYYITYRVKDSNGNWNDATACTGGQNTAENVRTVVIIDTLRPVIELKYNSQVIHQSAKEFSGSAGRGDNTMSHTGAVHNGAVNPAGSFMAEEASTSSVNGWVIGAVASAVSGLALLGYSLRKSAPVATSVPV